MGSTRLARTASGLLVPRPQFFQGNCPCCGTVNCDLFSDEFTRADSTNIGSDWSETAGDWSIASNALTVSTTFAVCLSTHDNTDANTSISAVVNSATSNTRARLIFSYTDANNFSYAELIIGAANALRICRKSGGTEDVITTATLTTATSTDYTFSVCYDSATSQVCAVVDGTTTAVSLETVTDGTWGVGTGSVSGAVIFKSVAGTVVSGSCTTCSCTAVCGTCLGTFLVTLPSLSGTCGTDCSNLGGAGYYCTYRGVFSGDCLWEYVISPSICPLGPPGFQSRIGGVVVRLKRSGAVAGFAVDDLRVSIDRVGISAGPTIYWQTAIDPADCDTISSLSIPMIANDTDCGSTSDVVVTAV